MAEATRTLKFNGKNEKDEARFKWLLISFVRAGSAAGAESTGGNVVAMHASIAILNAFYGVSVIDETQQWPGFSIEEAGFTARILKTGPQAMTLTYQQFLKLKKSVDIALPLFSPVTQQRFFEDIVQWLEELQHAKDEPAGDDAGDRAPGPRAAGAGSSKARVPAGK